MFQHREAVEFQKKWLLYSDLPDFKSYVDKQSERETRKKKYYKKPDIA
jgi:hypothetical protein